MHDRLVCTALVGKEMVLMRRAGVCVLEAGNKQKRTKAAHPCCSRKSVIYHTMCVWEGFDHWRGVGLLARPQGRDVALHVVSVLICVFTKGLGSRNQVNTRAEFSLIHLKLMLWSWVEYILKIEYQANHLIVLLHRQKRWWEPKKLTYQPNLRHWGESLSTGNE